MTPLLRRLWRDRVFTLLSIGTLALGVGVATALFSLVRGVLLRPLPYRDPERLVWVWAARTDRDKAFFSIANFLDTRAAARSIEELWAVSLWGVNLTGAGEPERLQGIRVSPEMLARLGVRPALGRLLDGGDEGKPVAVLAHGLWRRRFGGDPAVLGRSVTLNGAPFEIVGVLPASFGLPNVSGELVAPLALATDPRRAERGRNFLRAVGRLAPGRTAAQAQAELAAITRELVARDPEANAKLAPPRVIPLREELVGGHRAVLALTFAACLLLLLVACSNLSHLLLVRAAGRAPELAVRAALGASRGALVRPLLAEAALLACGGGVGGLALAAALVRAVDRLAPETLPRLTEVRLDAGAAGFALLLTTSVTLVLGAAPAGQAWRRDLGSRLRGRGTDGGRATGRGTFVATQVAVALVLLAACGGALLALTRQLHADAGFEARGLRTFKVSLTPQRAADPAALGRFREALAARLGALPGVLAVAVGQALPLSGENVRMDFRIVGRPAASAAEAPGSQLRWVSPGYFSAMGIPIRRGRELEPADEAGGRRVAVVDEALVHRFFDGLEPIGQRLVLEDPGGEVTCEVVGVAGDVRHFTLDEAPMPTLYAPLAQATPGVLPFLAANLTVAVRSGLEPAALAPGLRRELRALAPEVPMSEVRSMEETVAAVTASQRFGTRLLAFFGAAAFGLAVAGVYAVACQSVLFRRREIGLRLALGGGPGRVAGQLVGGGLVRVAAGAALGLALSAVLVRLLPANALLPAGSGLGVPVAAALLLLLVTSALATWVPARRASRMDPARVLGT